MADSGRPRARPSTGARARLVVIMLAMCGLAASLVQTLIVPLLPLFPRLLGVSPTTASWLVTSTLLTGAFSTAIMGRLGDLYGRRRMLLVALGFLVGGSVVCALADSLWLLLAGRALQGVAMAAIPLGIALLGTVVEGHRVPSGIALVSATMGIGGAVGLPVAGWVVEVLDYHALFWACGGVAALVAVGVAVAVPTSHRGVQAPVDLVGGLLFVALLTCLLLPLSNGASWGWTSVPTVGFALGFVVLVAVFVPYERRRAHPLIDLRALATGPVLLVNVASALTGFALFANFLGTPAFLQVPEASGYGLGMSPIVAGLALLPGGLAMALVSPAAGRIIVRRGPRQVLVVGLAIVAVGYAWRLVLHDQLWMVMVAATVISVGAAVAMAAMPALVLSVSPPADAGAATGINALARSIGTSIASASSAAVLAALTVTSGGAVFPSLGAFTTVAAIGGVAAVVACVCLRSVPARRPVTERHPAPLR